MHGPSREPLPECASTALLLIMLSWAALTPSAAATIDAGAPDVAEPALAPTATRDLVNLAGQVSGMVFSRAPDDSLALTLRGVGTPARPQAFDQSIALFLDGTYLAKGPLYPSRVSEELRTR